MGFSQSQGGPTGLNSGCKGKSGNGNVHRSDQADNRKDREMMRWPKVDPSTGVLTGVISVTRHRPTMYIAKRNISLTQFEYCVCVCVCVCGLYIRGRSHFIEYIPLRRFHDQVYPLLAPPHPPNTHAHFRQTHPHIKSAFPFRFSHTL